MESSETSSPRFEHCSAELMLCAACNLNCSYCIAHGLSKHSMSVGVGKRSIDLMVYLANGAHTIDITFTGGEPLLRRSTMLHIYEYAKERCEKSNLAPHFILKTNGTLLDDDLIHLLSDPLWTVVVSIDGTRSIHDQNRRTGRGDGSYEKVRTSILRMLTAGVSVTAGMTVHPDSCGCIASNLQHLLQIGLSDIDIGPVYGTVKWDAQQADSFAKALRKVALLVKEQRGKGKAIGISPIRQNSVHTGGQLADSWGCHAGSSHLAFLPDGSICGCSALGMLAGEFNYLVLGDISNGINPRALDEFLLLAQAGTERRITCMACKTALNCSGGCLASIWHQLASHLWFLSYTARQLVPSQRPGRLPMGSLAIFVTRRRALCN